MIFHVSVSSLCADSPSATPFAHPPTELLFVPQHPLTQCPLWKPSSAQTEGAEGRGSHLLWEPLSGLSFVVVVGRLPPSASPHSPGPRVLTACSVPTHQGQRGSRSDLCVPAHPHPWVNLQSPGSKLCAAKTIHGLICCYPIATGCSVSRVGKRHDVHRAHTLPTPRVQSLSWVPWCHNLHLRFMHPPCSGPS